jgi:TolB-like protein
MLSGALLYALILQPPPPTASPAPSDVPTDSQAAPTAAGLEARTRALADQVAFELKKLAGDHRLQTFAVVPFSDAGPEAEQRRLGLVVSDMLATELAKRHNLPLVERAALNKIFEEQALGQLGAIDEKQAANIGKLSGARAMVVGQVTDVPDGFRVSVRCVDAETASVLTVHDATLPGAELVAYSAQAVVLRSKSGALFRSLVVPGWGQLYNEQPVKAVAFGAFTGAFAVATLATLGGGLYLGYGVYPNIRNEKGTDAATETVDTRVVANGLLTTGGVLAGVTAVTWGVNVLDAYLSGHDVESQDAALATR